MEIQIEALSFILESEKEIGVNTEEERRKYIVPLEKRLDELKRAREKAK